MQAGREEWNCKVPYEKEGKKIKDLPLFCQRD